jgi:hypothetical protein
MRNVLHNEDPAKNIATNLKLAVLISFMLLLPFAILESLNNTITKQNAPSLLVLFGLLWLLALAFIVILMPIVRAARARNSVMTNPINLLFRIAFLALIAMMWVGIVIDQLPYFMGVANCD